MEGRDVGTVIFPEADFRFFLLADEAERTRRRQGRGKWIALVSATGWTKGEKPPLSSNRKEPLWSIRPA